jgi:hypothetical protein
MPPGFDPRVPKPMSPRQQTALALRGVAAKVATQLDADDAFGLGVAVGVVIAEQDAARASRVRSVYEQASSKTSSKSPEEIERVIREVADKIV